VNRWNKQYRPANLVSVLDYIKSSYGLSGAPPGSGLRVVGWGGEVLDPQNSDARSTVAAAVTAAEARLNG
jgi:hypothetical protein